MKLLPPSHLNSIDLAKSSPNDSADLDPLDFATVHQAREN